MRKCPCGEELAIGIRQGRPRRYCSASCRKRAWRQRRAVPRKMRATPRWVRWTLEPRGDKFTKVPRQLNGRHASSTNPRTWATFAAARASTLGEGLGWVLGEGIGCLDLDDCIVDGRLQPWAEEIIRKYRRRALLIERSWSGEGVHIFMRMKPGAGRRIRDGRNIEVYPPDSGRYIAVTGRRFDLDGGVVVDRELKPCGTPAAARRHRRRGEPVDDECRAAERSATATARSRKRAEEQEAAALAAEQVPEEIDQLTELRFMYGRIRGALQRAEPKEIATLVKQGDQILTRIAQLAGGPPVAHVSEPAGDEIDQFRRRREERQAAR